MAGEAMTLAEAARAVVEKATKWETLKSSPYVVQEPEFEALKAALAGEPAGDGWLPIETAPRDGTMVWLFRPDEPENQRQGVGWWHEAISIESAWWWMDVSDTDQSEPTHWRPLPAPPSRRPGQGGE